MPVLVLLLPNIPKPVLLRASTAVCVSLLPNTPKPLTLTPRTPVPSNAWPRMPWPLPPVEPITPSAFWLKPKRPLPLALRPRTPSPVLLEPKTPKPVSLFPRRPIPAGLWPSTAMTPVVNASIRPATVNGDPGVVVPMPTLPSTSVMTELPIWLVLVHLGIRPAVPVPLTEAFCV